MNSLSAKVKKTPKNNSNDTSHTFSWEGSYSYMAGYASPNELIFTLYIYEENEKLVADFFIPSIECGIYGKLDITEKDDGSLEFILLDNYVEVMQSYNIGDWMFTLSITDNMRIYAEWGKVKTVLNGLDGRADYIFMHDGYSFVKESENEPYFPLIGKKYAQADPDFVPFEKPFNWIGSFSYSAGFDRHHAAVYYINIYEKDGKMVGELLGTGWMYDFYVDIEIVENEYSIELILKEYYGYSKDCEIGDTLLVLTKLENDQIYTEWKELVPPINVNSGLEIITDGICFEKMEKPYEMPRKS